MSLLFYESDLLKGQYCDGKITDELREIIAKSEHGPHPARNMSSCIGVYRRCLFEMMSIIHEMDSAFDETWYYDRASMFADDLQYLRSHCERFFSKVIAAETVIDRASDENKAHKEAAK